MTLQLGHFPGVPCMSCLRLLAKCHVKIIHNGSITLKIRYGMWSINMFNSCINYFCFTFMYLVDWEMYNQCKVMHRLIHLLILMHTAGIYSHILYFLPEDIGRLVLISNIACQVQANICFMSLDCTGNCLLCKIMHIFLFGTRKAGCIAKWNISCVEVKQ